MAWGRLLVIGLVGIGLFACHSSKRATNDSGAGGGSTVVGTGGHGGSATAGSASGGASSGGAGAQGGAATGETHATGGTGGNPGLDPTEVCRAAIRAQAERLALCRGKPLDMLMQYADLCPDYYFNPDSNRTVEGIAACVPLLAALTCTDVALYFKPACFTHGKRDPGAACAFASQCQSGVCERLSPGCGTCDVGAKPVGSACSGWWECASGSYCDSKTSTCLDITTTTHADLGEPCDLSASPIVGCVGDLFCQPGDGGTAGTCLAAPALGQPCGKNGLNSSSICAAGTSCNNGTCDLPGTCGQGVQCGSGSYCATGDGGLACAPAAALGQACNNSSPPCLLPAVCSDHETCVVPRAVGETCDTANPCTDMLTCEGGICRFDMAAFCPS